MLIRYILFFWVVIGYAAAVFTLFFLEKFYTEKFDPSVRFSFTAVVFLAGPVFFTFLFVKMLWLLYHRDPEK